MSGKLLAVTLLPDAFPYQMVRQCVRISACTMRQWGRVWKAVVVLRGTAGRLMDRGTSADRRGARKGGALYGAGRCGGTEKDRRYGLRANRTAW